jgi:Holliday junction resolvase YEN1
VCYPKVSPYHLTIPLDAHSLPSPNVKRDGDKVAIYMAESLIEQASISLTEGGMLLFVLLVGWDYDQVSCQLWTAATHLLWSVQTGLRGCGTSVAYGLAKSGLGESLLQAVQSLARHDLLFFLPRWRRKLQQELAKNASGLLTQKQPSLARKVSAKFPDVNVLLQYANPVMSWTEDTPPNTTRWIPGQLDIAKLALLCELFFTWGTASLIMANFRKNIYAGACIQHLPSVRQCPVMENDAS